MSKETIKETKKEPRRKVVTSIKITPELSVIELTEWLHENMNKSVFTNLSVLKDGMRLVACDGLYESIVNEEGFQENYIDIQEVIQMLDYLYMSKDVPVDIFHNYQGQGQYSHMDIEYISALFVKLSGGTF